MLIAEVDMSSGAPPSHPIRGLIAALLLPMLASIPEADAQPLLDFKRVVSNWPTNELYFTVSCNGNPTAISDKKYIRLVENGFPVETFNLWCPGPNAHCAVSVALVFDASGSMSGSGNAGAKAAGHAYVDLIDGWIDEAAVLWFNTQVTVYQSTTSVKDVLHDAVDALPASGGTALWDGIHAGVVELVQNGVNQCRAVIALTDGFDNASSRTPAEIIALANRNHIRIFTVGLGSGINTAQLQSIADLTGGRFYHTQNANVLPAIYQEIFAAIFEAFHECVVTYAATCMDGTIRPVDLSIVNLCGGSNTKTKSYRAPIDTSTYTPLRLRLGTAVVRGSHVVKIPLELHDPVGNEVFHASTFRVMFDSTCAKFESIDTVIGGPLAGIPITTMSIPGGVEFRITGAKVLHVSKTPSVLAELAFTASDPTGLDTVRCPVRFDSWQFDAGCFRPVLGDGEIRIVPRRPVLTCMMDTMASLVWVRSLKDYTPNPFMVKMTVTNIGDREAQNARFTIGYNKQDLSLVSPLTDVQPGSPQTVIVQGTSTASWDVTARRRIAGDSLTLCITASFDNHPDAVCCRKVWVPPADPVLNCTVTAPVITSDRANQRYSPMPFDVTVHAQNEGGKRTDTVYAKITVPPDLKLAGPDVNRHTKKVQPSILNPGQQGGLSWTLSHPITTVRKEYTVRVCVWSSNADTSCCDVRIVIPSIDVPKLSLSCTVPDSLRFDVASDGYTPDPFAVTAQCINIGGLPASNVTALLVLPNGAVFADSTERALKTFSPSTIDVFSGGPRPQLSWKLRWATRPKQDQLPEFRVVAGGSDPSGYPLDSVFCLKWMRVRKTPVPALTPLCLLPDTLDFDAASDSYIPNPFAVSVECPNYGGLPAANVAGTITLPDGMEFADSTEMARKVFVPSTIDVYKGGAFPKVTWQVRFVRRLTSDTTRRILITVDATTPQGFPVDTVSCSRQLMITKIIPGPSARIAANGPLVFCTGDSVLLFAGAGYASYRWNNGDTTESIVVKTSGSYTVTVSDRFGRPGTSPAVTVTVLPTPKPLLQPSGFLEFCEGDTVRIDGGAGYATYRWNNGHTGRFLTVITGGIWYVDVNATNGCPGRSDTLTTIVKPLPAIPTITRNGDVLTTQPAAGYQWFKDGIAIPGAVNQTILVAQPGSYTVTITNTEGCSRTSEPFLVTTLPAEIPPRPAAWTVDVHPDPASDLLMVSTENLPSSPLIITLLDPVGRVIARQDDPQPSASARFSFDLGARSSGVYFVLIRCDGRSAMRRFVKLR